MFFLTLQRYALFAKERIRRQHCHADALFSSIFPDNLVPNYLVFLIPNYRMILQNVEIALDYRSITEKTEKDINMSSLLARSRNRTEMNRNPDRPY